MAHVEIIVVMASPGLVPGLFNICAKHTIG
nr:MAG TPA: hypothetical protein [Microviridae sp.]